MKKFLLLTLLLASCARSEHDDCFTRYGGVLCVEDPAVDVGEILIAIDAWREVFSAEFGDDIALAAVHDATIYYSADDNVANCRDDDNVIGCCWIGWGSMPVCWVMQYENPCDSALHHELIHVAEWSINRESNHDLQWSYYGTMMKYSMNLCRERIENGRD